LHRLTAGVIMKSFVGTTYFILILYGLTVFLLGCKQVPETVTSKSPTNVKRGIWNGTPSSREEFGYFAPTSAGNETNCSASVIGTRCLLTAVHCLKHAKYFCLGDSDKDPERKCAKVIDTRSLSNQEKCHNDMALVLLSDKDTAIDPSDYKPIEIDYRKPKCGTVELIGYGNDKMGFNSDGGFRAKRSGKMHFDKFGVRILGEYYPQCMNLLARENDDPQQIALGGDSGGAILMRNKLIGIIVRTGRVAKKSTGASVYFNSGWLLKQIENFCPPL